MINFKVGDRVRALKEVHVIDLEQYIPQPLVSAGTEGTVVVVTSQMRSDENGTRTLEGVAVQFDGGEYRAAFVNSDRLPSQIEESIELVK